MTIWLKDYPQTLKEFNYLMIENKKIIQGITIIEEEFAREEEDDIVPSFAPDPTLDAELNEVREKEKKIKLSREFTKEQRCEIFETCLAINQMAKNSPLGSEVRLTHIHKTKFKGPDPPILTQEEEEDEGRKEQEQVYYSEFAVIYKKEIE